MRKAVRSKICWNCEADVAREASNCPYCAVYLHPEEESNQPSQPPYPMNDDHSLFSENNPSQSVNTNISQKTEKIKQPAQKKASHLLFTSLSLFLLMSGALFCIFGLALWLFSKDGFLTLQWSSSFWLFYLLFSIPLLFFGCFFLRKIQE